MILLLTNSKDRSVTKVCQWLSFLNQEFIRINENEFVQYYNELIPFIDSENIIAFIRKTEEEQVGILSEFEEKRIRKHLNSELNTLKEYFINFSTDFKIGDICNDTNRLSTLEMASQVGLIVPKSKVVCTSDQVLKFKEKHALDDLVVKPITYPLAIRYNSELNKSYTELLDLEVMESVENQFFPSLVMEKIEKKYEIRTLFLNDEFYSMAIFSQNNKQTSVDFRRYDSNFPSRTVPYKLPEDIEEKLRMLFKELGLNTGSVDLIKNKNDEFVFL